MALVTLPYAVFSFVDDSHWPYPSSMEIVTRMRWLTDKLSAVSQGSGLSKLQFADKPSQIWFVNADPNSIANDFQNLQASHPEVLVVFVVRLNQQLGFSNALSEASARVNVTYQLLDYAKFMAISAGQLTADEVASFARNMAQKVASRVHRVISHRLKFVRHPERAYVPRTEAFRTATCSRRPQIQSTALRSSGPASRSHRRDDFAHQSRSVAGPNRALRVTRFHPYDRSACTQHVITATMPYVPLSQRSEMGHSMQLQQGYMPVESRFDRYCGIARQSEALRVMPRLRTVNCELGRRNLPPARAPPYRRLAQVQPFLAPSDRDLFVAGIPERLTKYQLAGIFLPSGELRYDVDKAEIYTLTNGVKVGVVTFRTKFQALHAVEEFNGTFVEQDGVEHPLVCIAMAHARDMGAQFPELGHYLQMLVAQGVDMGILKVEVQRQDLQAYTGDILKYEPPVEIILE